MWSLGDSHRELILELWGLTVTWGSLLDSRPNVQKIWEFRSHSVGKCCRRFSRRMFSNSNLRRCFKVSLTRGSVVSAMEALIGYISKASGCLGLCGCLGPRGFQPPSFSLSDFTSGCLNSLKLFPLTNGLFSAYRLPIRKLVPVSWHLPI